MSCLWFAWDVQIDDKINNTKEYPYRSEQAAITKTNKPKINIPKKMYADHKHMSRTAVSRFDLKCSPVRTALFVQSDTFSVKKGK